MSLTHQVNTRSQAKLRLKDDDRANKKEGRLGNAQPPNQLRKL